MSRCLGRRIADLADGRLGPAETERAFAHVAVCATCRAALAAQRAVIDRLDTAPPAEPSADLLARLSGIAGTDEVPAPSVPAQSGAGTRPGGAAGRRPTGSPPGSTRPQPRRRRRRIAIAGAAGAAAIAVAVAVGGSSSVTSAVVPRPGIAPVVDTLTDEHAVSADQMPFSGPRIVTVSYADPTTARPQPSRQP